jgi:hypothetical protein
MQEEHGHPTRQAQPAPELARPVTAHQTTISRNLETGTPPPGYDECVEILRAVPATQGNLSTGAAALDPMVIVTRLERLEARLDRIEAAAILDMQQQLPQTCDQTSSGPRHSLRPFCRRVRSDLVKGTRRLHRRIRYWLGDQCGRVGAYGLLLAAKTFRFSAWCFEVGTDPARPERGMAQAAEVRRKADECEEEARCILESLKNSTSFEGSIAKKLPRSRLLRRIRCWLWNQCGRVGAYWMLFVAKGFRVSAWLMEVGNPPPCPERKTAKIAEARRSADECEEIGRRILESLNTP